MGKRQLANTVRPSESLTDAIPSCMPFTLPSNGVLTLDASTTITLGSDAIYQPECTGSSGVIIAGSSAANRIHFRDPFYASTLPECYALAAATVIAYMLVIMLLITPRSFLHQGAVVLGRRGFTSGPSAGEMGIGGRPLLQKVAALTVAISLTIATADTFRVAEAQYEVGFMDAQALQNEVEDSMKLKVIRVISDTFLWLAQAQTLTRLFPRHKEKVIIKWTAFALITLDQLFSILNNFAYEGTSRPRSFVDAVPALAYLFRLALSLLYAAWVIYYSITKKEFAFYCPQMKNMFLVALLSLLSILVPIVFFITDISKPDLAGWGDYVRWVGAAAASVVVWEWVERIEALESNEKKDSVLGHEVFDDDDVLDGGFSSTDVAQRVNSHKTNNINNSVEGDEGGISSGATEKKRPMVSILASHLRPRKRLDIESGNEACQSTKANEMSVSSTRSSYTLKNMKQSKKEPKISQHNVVISPREGSIEEDVILESKDNGAKKIKEECKTQSQNSNSLQSVYEERSSEGRSQELPLQVPMYVSQKKRLSYEKDRRAKGETRLRLENLASSQVYRIRQMKARKNADIKPLQKTVIPAPPRRSDMGAALHQLQESDRGSPSVNNDSKSGP